MQGEVCVVGMIVTVVGVRVGALGDGIGIVGVGVGVECATVGVVGSMEGVIGIFGVGGVSSSQQDISITLGGSSPFLTRISVDVKTVGQEALRPTVLLPWVRDFVLLKNQF